MTPIELYTVIVVHAFAIPANLYPLVYRRVPWKKGPTGKALMNMARSLALLFDIGLVGFWWPFSGYAYVYAVVLTYFGCAISYQFGVMLRLRRRMSKRFLEDLERRATQLPPTHERLT